MDYNTIEDFSTDNSFIAWCLQSKNADSDFWVNYQLSHPDQREIIAEAKQLVIDLHEIEAEENEGRIEQEIWKNIQASMDDQTEKSNIRSLQPLLKYAAAIILLLFIVAFALNRFSNSNLSNTQQTTWINYENSSGLVKTIQLADNSTITLEPFSSLKYPTTFEGEQRKVFLKGEAFFDISRDTLRPFLVFANETVTKVLGTSFRIIAFEGQKTVEVEVKTGKVAVYANVDSGESTKKKKHMIIQADEEIVMPLPNKKLEVTPNQKVIFDTQKENMVKAIAPLPYVIKEVEELPQFTFNNEPLNKVFEILEQAYGIDLLYNQEKLRNCHITTRLNEETLFQKLDIICAALNLKFKEKDATIIISGEGC